MVDEFIADSAKDSEIEASLREQQQTEEGKQILARVSTALKSNDFGNLMMDDNMLEDDDLLDDSDDNLIEDSPLSPLIQNSKIGDLEIRLDDSKLSPSPVK